MEGCGKCYCDRHTHKGVITYTPNGLCQTNDVQETMTITDICVDCGEKFEEEKVISVRNLFLKAFAFLCFMLTILLAVLWVLGAFKY